MINFAANWLASAQRAAEQGDTWTAVDCLRGALESPDSLREQWATATKLAAGLGDEWGAVRAARRLYAEAPKTPLTTFILASALAEAGQASAGADLLVPLADQGKLSQNDSFRLLRMLILAGRLDEAQRRARQSLDANVDSPGLWLRIAQSKRFAPDDPDIDRMCRLFDRIPESEHAPRAVLARAIGRAFVDLGDDAAAARYLDARGAAAQALLPSDLNTLETAAREIVLAFRANPSLSAPPLAEPDGPVFVLGMARSGTALLDRVLLRHAAIGGGGALKHMALVARALGDLSSVALTAFLRRMTEEAPRTEPWSEVGRRYTALGYERFGGSARFTDSLRGNIYRAGVIRLALPAARLVHVKRNALDMAWSCWRTQFDSEEAWSASPEGIARYIALLRRLMDAWGELYPGWIAEVAYEDLVTRPEEEIPSLLKACGLPDDPATREPHLSARDTSAMSYAQAREPIHVRSVGHAALFPVSTRKLRVALEAAGLET